MININSPILIEIKNLVSKFGTQIIHNGLNLAIQANRTIAIIGESGCGKTTLIREILRLEEISGGEIYLMGQKISHLNLEHKLTKNILAKMGVMFQQGALFSSMNVIENVMFPLYEYSDFDPQTIKEIAYIKLNLTGLAADAYHKYPKELSGGMLKRVALARALVLDPALIFLDEPTAGLDPNSANLFDQLIHDLQQQLNLTIIMITHDLDTIWNIADEIIYIGEQKVLFHGAVNLAAEATEIKNLYNYFNGARGHAAKQYYQK